MLGFFFQQLPVRRLWHPSSNVLFTVLLVLAIVVSGLNLYSMHNNRQAARLERATFRAVLVDSMARVSESRVRESRRATDSLLSSLLKTQGATAQRLQKSDEALQHRYWLKHPATHRALPAL